MITFATLLVFALSNPLPIEEVDMAFTEGISTATQHLLLSDAFAQLDTNGNGFLTKAERKPLLAKLFRPIAELYVTPENPDVVTKTAFVKGVLVPDFGSISDPTEEDCDNEAAFVGMTGEEFWNQLMGTGVEAVTVQECAENWYEALEDDEDITQSEFEARFLEGTHPQPKVEADLMTDRFADAEGHTHVQQIDTYTTMHNSKCEMTDRRRRLMVAVPAVAALSVPAMGWVVATTLVGATMACTTQEVMHQWFPNQEKWVFSNEGCTIWQFTEDLVVTFGVTYAGAVMRNAWVRLASYMGWSQTPAVASVPGQLEVVGGLTPVQVQPAAANVIPVVADAQPLTNAAGELVGVPRAVQPYFHGMRNPVANTIGRTYAQNGATGQATVNQMARQISQTSSLSSSDVIVPQRYAFGPRKNPVVMTAPSYDGLAMRLKLANNPFKHTRHFRSLEELPHPLEQPEHWCGPSNWCRRRYLRELMAQYAQSGETVKNVERKM